MVTITTTTTTTTTAATTTATARATATAAADLLLVMSVIMIFIHTYTTDHISSISSCLGLFQASLSIGHRLPSGLVAGLFHEDPQVADQANVAAKEAGSQPSWSIGRSWFNHV